MDRFKEYMAAVRGMDAQQIAMWSVETFGVSRVVLASSFSVEDQVLTHMLKRARSSPRVFTLDTGRLFPETYEVWQKSVETWGISYEIYGPDPSELNALIAQKGPNLFYSSVEARKACCAVRKTHPLQKVLSTVDAWICGLRRDQAITRTLIEPVEWDEAHRIYKINPLYDWTEEMTWKYIDDNVLPFNSLQKKGFRSIGCAPCTRAIGPHDDIRSGRWWWEEPEHKECGLHNRPKPNSVAYAAEKPQTCAE